MTVSRQLVFLKNLPRSGSTHLCHWMSEFAEVGVSLEAVFPDGIVAPECRLKCRSDDDDFLDILYGRRPFMGHPFDGYLAKFRYWNVNEDQLRAQLQTCQRPIRYTTWLRWLLDLHLAAITPRVTVYKAGHYAGHIETKCASCALSSNSFSSRDPRYHPHKKKALDNCDRSIHGNPHPSSSPCDTSSDATHRQLQPRPWLYVLKYEEFLVNPEGKLAELMPFMGLRGTRRAQSVDYAARIPPSQQHLHPLAGKWTQLKRVDAWREELSRIEVSTIESIVGHVMNRFGYR